MVSRLAGIVLFVAASTAAAQQTPYSVVRNHVTSQMQPAIAIDVDNGFSYVGSQRFILYGVAQAEQHLFVEKRNGAVTRFLWIQFEEYLPSAATAKYDYSRSTAVQHEGREFRVDGALRQTPTTESRPDSDGARARALLREHGITLPPVNLYHRMVWLPDADKRKELMVIYTESLESQGLKQSELEGSAAAESKLAQVLSAHRERALRAFRITR